MCGIVGMITGMKDTVVNFKHNNAKASWLTQAIVVDTLRGDHSTGLLSVHAQSPDDLEIYKKAIPGDAFVHQPTYLALKKDVEDYPVLIAHNRKASAGSINSTNAHPFERYREDASGIAGVHNGSLTFWRGLTGSSECDVDSDAIFYDMAADGYVSTLKKLQGTFALVWYDSKDKKVRMCRNSLRPLVFASLKDSDTILYASEQSMLEFLCARNGLEIEDIYEVEEKKVYSFTPFDKTEKMKDSWGVEDVEYYTFQTTYTHNTRGDRRSQRIAQATGVSNKGYAINDTVKLSVETFATYSNQGQYKLGTLKGTVVKHPTCLGETSLIFKSYNVTKEPYFTFNSKTHELVGEISALQWDPATSTTIAQVRSLRLRPKLALQHSSKEMSRKEMSRQQISRQHMVKETEADVEETIVGPDGKLITMEEFDTLTEDGCSMCQSPIFISDSTDLKWMDNTAGGWDPLCLSCANDYQY